MAAAPEQLRWLLLTLCLPLAATAMQPLESRELSASLVGAQSLCDTASLVGAQSLRDMIAR